MPAVLNVSAQVFPALAAAADAYNRTHTTHTLGEKMYQEAIDRLEVQLEAARELPSWAIALITTASLCLGGVLLWCVALCLLAPCVWGWRRFDRDGRRPSPADVELELRRRRRRPRRRRRRARARPQFDDMDD